MDQNESYLVSFVVFLLVFYLPHAVVVVVVVVVDVDSCVSYSYQYSIIMYKNIWTYTCTHQQIDRMRGSKRMTGGEPVLINKEWTRPFQTLSVILSYL